VVEVKIYRAGSESEKGVKAFSSWSEDRSTAEAYLDNQGFGGSVLRSAVIHPNNVLDADTTNRRGMVKLAQSLGFDPSEGEEWFDAGWRYPWEESKRVKSAASSSPFDAIRYVDDFPEGALTIITTRDFKPEEETRLNPRQLMGININDSTQDFTGQILRGEKTIETRSTRSLDPYIGNRVGIIRTGVGKATLVGYATVGEPVVYDSVAKFRQDQSKHLVSPGSAFDIKDGLKYGYPLMQVEAVEPRQVESRGIVARRLNPYTKRIAMKTKEFRNPMDPRSAMTQIATTVNTYRKASKMLGGKVLDYGAGYGLGTDAMREEGLLAESFEPFPEEWKGKQPPTYTDSANIPSSAYDSLVSFSVINVVDPDERKFLFKEVARILRPDGFALITGRTRQDVSAAKTKRPHLEDGGYLIGEGEDERYQKGFTQAELERYAKEVLGPDFTVEKNGMLNGASIKITKGKTNPATRSMIRSKLSRIIEPDDRILCYDTAADEDFYRLWDIIHTDLMLNKESLREIEGMLDDDGVLVIESGETPAGLQDHFRKATRYQGLLLVQGPLNPEQARIETEKLRRDLE
jgi:SAM-dependent methyltransferase